MSAGTGTTAVAADRGSRALAGGEKIKAAIVGATGYVGSNEKPFRVVPGSPNRFFRLSSE